MGRVLLAAANPVVSVWKGLAVGHMRKVCVLHIICALFTMQYWHAAPQFMQSRCWRFLSERDKLFLDSCDLYVTCIYVAKSGCCLLCATVHAATWALCQRHATAVWRMCRSDFLADSQALRQKRKAHEAAVRQRRLQFQQEKYEHQLQAAGLWACVCVCVYVCVCVILSAC